MGGGACRRAWGKSFKGADLKGLSGEGAHLQEWERKALYPVSVGLKRKFDKRILLMS